LENIFVVSNIAASVYGTLVVGLRKTLFTKRKLKLLKKASEE
jgi:hypothetical protein